MQNMSEQTTQLGKLEAIYGVSPIYLQRALIIIVLSFIFFMAMLIAFSLRMQIGYFILATVFLVVKLVMLFGWVMNRKKEVKLYEKGLMIGKQTLTYDQIQKIELKQISAQKQEGEILKTDGQKIILSETISNIADIVKRVEKKLKEIN